MNKLNLYVEGPVRPESSYSPFYQKLFSMIKEGTTNKVIIYVPDETHVPNEIRELGSKQSNVSWLDAKTTAATTNVVVTSNVNFINQGHNKGYTLLFIIDDSGKFSPGALIRLMRFYDVHSLSSMSIFSKSGIELFKRDDVIILLNSTILCYREDILITLYLLDEHNRELFQKLMGSKPIEQPFFSISNYLLIAQEKAIRIIDGVSRKPLNLSVDDIILDNSAPSSAKMNALDEIGERLEQRKDSDLKQQLERVSDTLETVLDRLSELSTIVEEGKVQNIIVEPNDENPFLSDDPLLGFRNQN